MNQLGLTRRTFIAPVSWGLGDLVVSLPVVQALIDAGHETYLITRSNLQEQLATRVEGLAGCLPETAFDATILCETDGFINMREHPLQTDYWWGGPEFERDHPGLLINDILEIIARDYSISANFTDLRTLRFVERNEARGKIVLLPGSDGTHKCWLARHWLTLSELLYESGFSCLVIGEPENSKETKELLDRGMPWIETSTIGDAVDVISSSSAVVGVDTGLLHVAVTQGISTLGLFRNGPIYVRNYLHTSALIAKECAQECRSKYSRASYNEVTTFQDWTAPVWCCTMPEDSRCMASIEPETVATAVLRKLSQ